MKQTILSYLPGDHPWQNHIHWFDTIDSTNTKAKQMAAEGAPHGTVLIAGAQTAGRGRMGRSFVSDPAQGVYLSVILRPHCAAGALMHLTCAAGVAMCDAVERTVGLRPQIKWINDLIFHRKKLGGILTELVFHPATGLVDCAIVGIGINCCQKQQDFPADIRDMAVSLSMVTGKETDRAKLAAEMIRSLWEMDQSLPQKERIMDIFRRDCMTIGQEVVLLRGEEKRYGKALDVDNDGGLQVAFADGTVKAVSSGEVSLRSIS